MKTRKIRATVDQIGKLMEDIRTLPAEPVGEHLSDDEFISYSMETLTAGEVQRIDQHLASCPKCAEEMEALMQASEAWSGEQGEQRLTVLRQRVLRDTPIVKEDLLEHLAEHIDSIEIFNVATLQAAAAKTMDFSENGETEDGMLRWYITKEEGNLIVSFDSLVLDLEGTRLRLKAGDFQRDVVLERVASDQVGAEIIISQEEWGQWPEDVAPRFELVD